MSHESESAVPKSRTNHCMTSCREFLITFGGYSDWCKEGYDGFCIYNTLSEVWRQYDKPLPSASSSFDSSICAVGNLVYIFGGACCGSHCRPTNTLISFHLIDNTWKTIFPDTARHGENTPPLMCGNFLFHHNESLYVIGGMAEHQYLDTIYKFCLKTSTWSLVQQNGPKPLFKGRIFGTVFKNQFYCLSGTSITKPHEFREIWSFDFSTNAWTKKTTKSKTQKFPGCRIEESLAFSSNCCYLSGGRNRSLKIIYSDIWKLDLETLEWYELDYSLRTGLYLHCTSVVDDCYLFIFGGYGSRSNNHNTFERFIVRPPTLYRLGRESIIRSPNFERHMEYLPPFFVDEFRTNCKL
ncbi:Kelch domain-containing protein 10 [Thelohanellus kitauei]|uniref:Kelch domain-containing protein 10 n=1 Tax=Thelohanellus kitauei TaxID=669202 RepID=A0A0C2JI30_THEKT|nr:Kelch domain-containing protein 10 [Thelohanellus kitauei]